VVVVVSGEKWMSLVIIGTCFLVIMNSGANCAANCSTISDFLSRKGYFQFLLSNPIVVLQVSLMFHIFNFPIPLISRLFRLFKIF